MSRDHRGSGRRNDEHLRRDDIELHDMTCKHVFVILSFVNCKKWQFALYCILAKACTETRAIGNKGYQLEHRTTPHDYKRRRSK